jgi:hypothetical protein
MKSKAVWAGMLGAVIGVLLCLGLLVVVLFSLIFGFVEAWWLVAIFGLAVVSLIGFAGAVAAEQRPLRGALLMFIAALIWAFPGIWIVFNENGYYRIALIAPTVLFAIGSLLAWILHWQSQEPETPVNGTR